MVEYDMLTFGLLLPPLAVGLLLMLVGYSTPHRLKPVMEKWIKQAAFGFSLLFFIIATGVGWYSGIDFSSLRLNNYELEFSYKWMSMLGVNWHVGVDGLSFPMVWLTTMLIPLSILMSWKEKRGWYFHPLLLLMEAALIGVFISLDLFMFYIFWELTLIPMFFLILKWGYEDRRYAAQKFFIYTFGASLLMLLGIVALYFLQGPTVGTESVTQRTFDMTSITAWVHQANADGTLSTGLQHLLFILFLVGFLVKLPSVPFHTWLPDAHVQAPTAGSMLLAGVMLKMGAYGLIRLPVTLFPDSLLEFQWLLVLVGMVSLIYGAMVCLGQLNLKRMVAYSSVSHMGLVLLGIASLQPVGIAGAIFMMFAHGLISPMLFAVAGAFRHHFKSMTIDSMRGMAGPAPLLAGFMMFGWLASLGLPLLAGFVAEILILFGFWQQFGLLVVLPALTLIITAAYYLWSMQRTIFEGGDKDGWKPPIELGEATPSDVTFPEAMGLLGMLIPIILFGVMPLLIFGMMSDYSTELVRDVLVDALNRRG